VDRPWALAVAARGHALIAAAQGDLDSAVRELDRAMGEHERLAMPLELARTLLVKGQVHRRRREKRLADQALRESLRLFDEAGAALWAARVRAELARIGLRPRAPTDLTETETRVAALAAEGMTNRQVAKAAFISPKTVDNVLARVYRKLGISSRAQLGVVLAAIDDEHGGEGGIPTPRG
jgi:DNA-binding CsgD family transcriptional regulator